MPAWGAASCLDVIFPVFCGYNATLSAVGFKVAEEDPGESVRAEFACCNSRREALSCYEKWVRLSKVRGEFCGKFNLTNATV